MASNSDVCNYGFAFIEPRFSDRVMLIEVMPNSETESYGNAKWGALIRKLRGENGESSSGVPRNEHNVNTHMPDVEDGSACEKKDVEKGVPRNEHNVNTHMPDVEDGGACEKKDVEKDAINEKASSGCLFDFRDEATNRCDAVRSSDCRTVLWVKTIHISSAILAGNSPFFYRLFSNGIKDSKQQSATLRIHANEEAAVMDVIHFIYFNTLLTTTPSGLVEILLAADKFEVASCMTYCSQQLSNLPMTCDSALQYLDMTSSFLRSDAVQSLTDAAKQFLASQFQDLDRFQDQVLELSLSGIEAVLSSDEIQATSEDFIYDLVQKYASRHYQQMEERKEILEKRLRHLIRFPYMSTQKLMKVLTCRSFNSEVISKVVTDALFFKADPIYRHRMLASTRQHAGETGVRIDHQFVERAYKHRPVKVIEIERPYHHSIVYMDLKREECMSLFPAGKVYSQTFHLGSHGFYLSAHCTMDQQNTARCFGLYIGLQAKREPATVEADYEFAARKKPEEDFEINYRGSYVFTRGKAIGSRNLFRIPWSEFIGEGSNYFINGMLHLRVVVAIKQ